MTHILLIMKGEFGVLGAIRKTDPLLGAQSLHPSLVKGAHERKTDMPKGISGVNQLSEAPLFQR